MRAYINAQNPKTISAVIHHSMLAHKIFMTKEDKKSAEKNHNNNKPLEKASNAKKERNQRRRTRVLIRVRTSCLQNNLKAIARKIDVFDAVRLGTFIISVLQRRRRRFLRHLP